MQEPSNENGQKVTIHNHPKLEIDPYPHRYAVGDVLDHNGYTVVVKELIPSKSTFSSPYYIVVNETGEEDERGEVYLKAKLTDQQRAANQEFFRGRVLEQNKDTE